MNSPSHMIFGGECRSCSHEIRKGIQPNATLLNNDGTVRIRCASCRTINSLPQVDAK